jgi:ribonuclease PH
VGLVAGQPLLDLTYEEDSGCQVDMNIVMTGREQLIEVQGTAEHHPFTRTELDQLLDLATHGVRQLIQLQRNLIGEDRFAPNPHRGNQEPGKTRRNPENLVGA